MLPDEDRRVSSFWMPAFMAAVAASECGEDAAAMLREADGDWLRDESLGGDGDASGDGGSELMSGGIAVVYEYVLGREGVGMGRAGGLISGLVTGQYAAQVPRWIHGRRWGDAAHWGS
jgi:hypothetical protein